MPAEFRVCGSGFGDGAPISSHKLLERRDVAPFTGRLRALHLAGDEVPGQTIKSGSTPNNVVQASLAPRVWA